MKCYLINLDRSPERLERMAAVFAGVGIEFARIPAVDGKLLSAEEQRHWLSDGDTPYELTAGEIGCFLSHRKCWEVIAGSSESHFVIFEDDIHIGRNATEILSRVDWIPADADIVKIETFLHPTQMQRKPASVVCGRKITRLWRTHFGTGGYIISSSAASKLLSLSGKLSCPVDHFLFDPRFSGFSSLVIYQMSPALCVQEVALNSKDVDPVLSSTLHRERNPLGRDTTRKGLRKLRREIGRPFEQFWRMVWLSIKGRKRGLVAFE
ncbi:glycosyltransferase family 25 protein [Aquamicrobium terrae]